MLHLTVIKAIYSLLQMSLLIFHISNGIVPVEENERIQILTSYVLRKASLAVEGIPTQAAISMFLLRQQFNLSSFISLPIGLVVLPAFTSCQVI